MIVCLGLTAILFVMPCTDSEGHKRTSESGVAT